MNAPDPAKVPAFPTQNLIIPWWRAYLWVPSKKHFDSFLAAVWCRYTTTSAEGGGRALQPGGEDRALTYVEKIIDRQLNKVRGLLTINGILIAASRVNGQSPVLQFLTQALLLLSCGFCLRMFFVQWDRDLSAYNWIETELPNSVAVTAWRSRLITASVWLTFAGLIAFTGSLVSSCLPAVKAEYARWCADHGSQSATSDGSVAGASGIQKAAAGSVEGGTTTNEGR